MNGHFKKEGIIYNLTVDGSKMCCGKREERYFKDFNKNVKVEKCKEIKKLV